MQTGSQLDWETACILLQVHQDASPENEQVLDVPIWIDVLHA
jgi:hypothetical protein